MRGLVCLLAIGAGGAAAWTPSAAIAADYGRPQWSGYDYKPASPAPTRRSVDYAAPRDWWSGFYAGASIGYGTGTADVEGLAGKFSHSLYGGLFGLVGGYNWRRDSLVFGLEGEVKGGTLGGSAQVLGTPLSADLRIMGSGRARLGVLVAPALLLYGIAGVAIADFKLQGALLGSSWQQGVFWGGQIGGGAEMKLTEQWSLRVDYTYNKFREEQVGAVGLRNGYDPSFHSVQAAVTYRF